MLKKIAPLVIMGMAAQSYDKESSTDKKMAKKVAKKKMKKSKCPKCSGKGCSHCGGDGYHEK